jgi:ATP-dependent helicase HepA
MEKGIYVRCPVVIEPADEQFPRCFILAQVKKYNELSDAIEVVIHDLLGSQKYYPHIFTKVVFSANQVERCPAMPGTRFSSDCGEGYIAARILNNDTEAAYFYYVQFDNGSYLKLEEKQMKIEYSQMDYSPLKQMINYEFQNPSWYSNRIKVSRNAHMIKNASYGFKVLAGCRTYLLPHQISTISRCFEFSPIRYMLADEVGLGKTIEACGIIKIMLSTNIDLRVLFILPRALINQWKSELKYKFNLDISDDLKKLVVPLEELASSDVLQKNWDIVIIDETHRLLSMENEYQVAMNLSKQSPNILLLSATPIQDRNAEYLKLLTLLNPEQYENMLLSQFSSLVKKQKSIQRSVNQQIKRMDNFEEYGEAIIDKLQDICDNLEDKTLKKILDSVDTNAEDSGYVATSQALSYICENYRLERKVIRNRREMLASKMASRSLETISYYPASADDLHNEIAAIEAVLSYLSDNSDGSDQFITSIAHPLLSALFSSPWALIEQIKRMKIIDSHVLDCSETWAIQGDQELKNYNMLLDDPDLIKGRLLKVLDFIEQNTDVLSDPEYKIVVFTGHNATLRKFGQVIKTRFKEFGVDTVEFGTHMSSDELEDSVYDFQNDENCKVIICDETGGEGRNFQNAKMIVHLDLPWNANALEQRIGRLDRVGRDAKNDVLSVVIYSENTVEEQLYKIWKDGMMLFTQSLSGLEIITGELNSLIIDALLDDFHNGLTNAFEDILSATEEMREAVLDEQLFDIGATIYRPLSHVVTKMLTSYEGEEDNIFASSMLGWGFQAGLQSEKPTKTGLIQYLESDFSPRAALQSLFVPPVWRKYRSYKIFKREHQILGTFDRQLAIKCEDVLFFAPGDSIYDSIIANAIGCGRGRCTAISLDDTFNYTGFVFIYNVEPRIDELIESNLNVQILSQFKMFLPLEQLVVFVPLNAESVNVQEKNLKKILSESWKIRSANHLGKRGNFKSIATSPLEKFINAFPPSEWKSIVQRAERRAREKAKVLFSESSDLPTAKREIGRIINGYLSEALYFGKDESVVEEKRNAYKKAYYALTHSRLVLDSACFLKVVKKHELH